MTIFPNFSLKDSTGKTHQLTDYLGHYVVLYTYPKDNTPNCTKEACDFRDSLELKNLNVKILGLSADNQESHQKFIADHNLSFPLLLDENDFIRKIGAYGTRISLGKESIGVKRSTFIISPKGELIKHWEHVVVEGHIQEIIDFIKGHQSQ